MNVHLRLEGTSTEVNDVLQALPGVTELRIAAVELTDEVVSSETPSESAGSDSRVVTTRFVRHALTRLRLSPPMKRVLTALYEAHPDWLSLPTLHSIADYTPAQFAGLMGAFGRRLANTEGYDSDLTFFEYRWNEDEEVWDYRLPKTVCDALALEQLVWSGSTRTPALAGVRVLERVAA